MRDDQADQIIDLLGDLVSEIRGLRSEFMEFSGYNTMNMTKAVEAVTGPTGYSIQNLMGELPYTIEDLHQQLSDIAGTLHLIDINTQP